MIINDSTILGLTRSDSRIIWTGISKRAEKILDEMAKGLRENLITDDLNLAKQYLAKWKRIDDDLYSKFNATNQVHTQDLQSEESLRQSIKDLRAAGQTYQANNLENMLKAQQLQTEMHYKEWEQYVEPVAEANAYIEILGRQVDDLEIAAGNEKIKISENEAENQARYNEIADKQIDKEEREEKEKEIAEEKKEQEEIEEIEKEFWEDARNEKKIPWGKIAFGIGLVGLGFLLFGGGKSKKSKH